MAISDLTLINLFDMILFILVFIFSVIFLVKIFLSRKRIYKFFNVKKCCKCGKRRSVNKFYNGGRKSVICNECLYK